MKTTGFPSAVKELQGWASDVRAAQDAQMQQLADKLVYWAQTEHAWSPKRPHTESTISAEVTAFVDRVNVRLSVDMDAGLWLELAYDGRWAWLWPVVIAHASDIRALLAEAGVFVGDPARNPSVESEYRSAKAAMKAAR